MLKEFEKIGVVDDERIDYVLSLLLDSVGNLTSLYKKTFHSLDMSRVSVVYWKCYLFSLKPFLIISLQHYRIPLLPNTHQMSTKLITF